MSTVDIFRKEEYMSKLSICSLFVLGFIIDHVIQRNRPNFDDDSDWKNKDYVFCLLIGLIELLKLMAAVIFSFRIFFGFALVYALVLKNYAYLLEPITLSAIVFLIIYFIELCFKKVGSILSLLICSVTFLALI